MKSIPFTETQPTIDGKLTETVWENAVKLDQFKLTSGKTSGNSPKYVTTCWAIADKKNLYLAFKCMEPDTAGIVANNIIWDDADILYDDRVSVLLDIDHNHRSYYELVLNARGIQMDRSGFLRYPNTRTSEWDLTWNCFWRARTKIEKDHWIAEIAIDLKSLGMDSASIGTTLGFNVTRVRQPQIKKGEEWAHRKAIFPTEYSACTSVKDGIWETISNFYEPFQFADVVLNQPAIKVESLHFNRAKFNWGDVFTPSQFGWNPLKIKLSEYENYQKLDLKLTVKPENAATWTQTSTLTIDESGTLTANYFVPQNRENELTIELYDAENGNLLYKTAYILTTPPFIDFDLEPLYTRNPEVVRPISFKLVTDRKTIEASKLNIELVEKESGKSITSLDLDNLKDADQFQPIFDINQLRDLAGGNYEFICELKNKTDDATIGLFQQPFTKFEKEKPEKFGAIRGDYSFGGITDEAIRVQYPDGNEFVFWRAANYGPWWDIDQATLNHEHLESWGAYTQSCCEIMQDRELRYGTVEIVENSPARVVVHWRYALSDSHYKIHMNEWGDEYYYFYPDGIVIREVNLWANSNKKHEFFEAIPVKPPGVGNLQLYDQPLATLKNLDGQGHSTDEFWENDIQFYQNFIRNNENIVFEFNMKDRKHPFVVFAFREDILPGVLPDYFDLCSPRKNISKGDHRGHWPTSLYPIDGYNSIGNDRPHHGNIGSVKAMSDKSNSPNKWLMLLGLTTPDSKYKYTIGKNWVNPAPCKSEDTHVVVEDYNHAERAYEVLLKKTGNFSLTINAEKNEMINPVFKLKGLSTKPIAIGINGKKMALENYKIAQSNETDCWIVFLEKRIEQKENIIFYF